MKKTSRISISNMHCSNCSMAVEKHFNNLEDINVNVILSDNLGLFTYDDSKWDDKKIAKQLKSIGYPVAKDNKSKIDLIRLIICIVLTMPFVVSMILMNRVLLLKL